MTNEELTKIIAAIPVYEDEHYSLREYQDAKIIVMTMIENYNKLKTKYTKLKESIGKIKREIKNEDLYDDEGVLRSQVTHTWKVLDIIDKNTEGLI